MENVEFKAQNHSTKSDLLSCPSVGISVRVSMGSIIFEGSIRSVYAQEIGHGGKFGRTIKLKRTSTEVIFKGVLLRILCQGCASFH